MFALSMNPASSGASEALVTSFTAIAADVTGVLTSALPIALGVVGFVIAVRFGIRWFRSILR